MQRSDIIKAIDDFSAKSGLKPSTIGQYAARNRNAYKSLKSEGRVSIATIERLLCWMADNPPETFRGAAE